MAKLFSLPYGPRYFWRNIPYLWLGIKSFYLRGKNGWSPYDTWNMDNYLLTILPEMLDYLANNIHGYPSDIIIEGESDEDNFNRWQNYLRITANYLRESDEDKCSKNKELEQYERYTQEYWDKYKEINEYRQECLEKALEAIKLNFWNLWD